MLLDDDTVFNMFKGKSVALIGPAQNLIGTSKGKFIDSFDIVCRIQNGFIIDAKYEDDYGKRCDIIFNTCNLTTLCSLKRNRSYIKQDCKLIICPMPELICKDKIDYKINKKNMYENYLDTNIDIPFYKVPDYKDNGLNTGLQCIQFLLTTSATQIYIAGFDFHQIKNTNTNIKNNWKTYLCSIDKIHCTIKDCICKKRINDINPSNYKERVFTYNFFKSFFLNNSSLIIDENIKTLF